MVLGACHWQAVEAAIQSWGKCTLSIDGWEDHAKCESLGIMARPMTFGGKPVLLSWSRQCARQTSEHLAEQLKTAVAFLKQLNCTPWAILSDNAANMRAAVRDLPGVFGITCMAIGDLMDCN